MTNPMNQELQWARTGDRRTWSASTGNTAMTVTRLSTGRWRAAVEDARSPELATRLITQRWAEVQAGAR
jgi:hypothetical protein